MVECPMDKEDRKHAEGLAKTRAELRRTGRTYTSIAKELKMSPNLVHTVLHGRNKGRFGKGHRVLVHLGLK